MSTSVTLGPEASGSVVLDGSGNGTVKVGPQSVQEVWMPSVASVSASSHTNEASCKIYAGPTATPGYFVDGTLSGSTGDSTAKIGGVVIPRNWFIFAVWSGGDAGAVATLNVNGTKLI